MPVSAHCAHTALLYALTCGLNNQSVCEYKDLRIFMNLSFYEITPFPVRIGMPPDNRWGDCPARAGVFRPLYTRVWQMPLRDALTS